MSGSKSVIQDVTAKTMTSIISDDDSEEEMAVFKQPGKKRKMNMNQDANDDPSMSNDDSIMTNDSSTNNSLITDDEDENHEPEIKSNTNKMPKKSKPIFPKIYFCTRTHKQIEQVVKELQTTNFNDVKSCVLASRELTCIQDTNIFYPDISYRTKTELCKDLLDPKARKRNSMRLKRFVNRCAFYDNGGLRIGTYAQLARYDVSPVWDIEDIVRLGRQKNSCPYYGSRMLLKTADIVFCPYNYIIDPVIRGTMSVKLHGHVIIVDEAHNIEDQCRDAASLRLDQTKLNLAKMDCEKVSKLGQNSASYAVLAQYLADLSKWIDQKSDEIKTYDDYNRGIVSWSGTYIVASFEEFGIGLEKFENFKKHWETVSTDEESEPEETDENNDMNLKETIETLITSSSQEDIAITNATKNMLTSICMIFCLFFDEKYVNDYHISLEKMMQVKKSEHNETSNIDTWVTDGSKNAVWHNVINFLCLNPAAVFHELNSVARSIILTSGTLAPLSSFQSELGTKFPLILEANHVIKPEQCWVTSVGYGPSRIDLNGQYQNTNTYGFQDEMGRVLKDVCESVPYGVLCFIPSYLLIEKLYARWQLTGLLNELRKIKVVMCEPRRGDQLEELMTKYYTAIRKASAAPSGQRPGKPNGALFLAVYRGKISEGLDFSDNNARAVVAVGIPFPNYKDVAVNYKKIYNNTHSSTKGLLPGWEWYQIQAYRALNQALGRCIRHKNDWGAILLVDSRYTQPKNLAGLSKWIRGRVEHNGWSSIVEKLKHFIEMRQHEDSNS